MDNTRGINFEVIALGEPYALKPITQSKMAERNFRRFARAQVAARGGSVYTFDMYTSYSAGDRAYWNYVVCSDSEALRVTGTFSPGDYVILDRAMCVCKYLVSQPEFWWPLS